MRVPLAAATLCLVPVFALPQSLGDAAKREARKRVSQPASAPKAYTDADLPTDRERDGTETDPAPFPAESEAAAPSATAGSRPTPIDPVREALDREAANRRSREETWKRNALATLDRLERAESEYQVACGPQALDLAGG